MTRDRDDVVGMDGSILMNRRVWQASGHEETFSDPMVDCKASKKRYRADQLEALPTETPTETPVPNLPPLLEPLGEVVLLVGESVTVPLVANDPEGAALFVEAVSSDPSIASGTPDPAGALQVTLTGLNPGQVTITITVRDPEGQPATQTFPVIVNQEVAQPPSIDLNALPEVPDASGEVLSNIQSIYNPGRNQPNVFITAGDVPPERLLADASSAFDLSGAPELQGVLEAYLNTPLGDGNVLTRGGQLSTNPSWTVTALLDGANNPPGCDGQPNPLTCALENQRPAVTFLLVGRGDAVAGTSPDAFAANLGAAVDTVVNSGSIPVLVTVPGDPTRVEPYNQAIARLAQERNLPLWNLWRAIPASQVNSDLTLTSPGAGQNALLTPDNLTNFGTVRRNLGLLRLLERLRNAVPLN
ncbi:MAG: hypothetical protein HC915_13890 [Anaerolineae bacterium]|nr:hypothetical protein [Anaerolineae bacterium]